MAGPKLLTFAQWRKQAVGKHIDIDGAYGAQCWDLWADYAFRAHGATGIMPWTSANAGADSGLASSLWLRFPARPGIDGLFSRIGRHETPYEGDVAVWARSQPFPDSHVAVCTGRTRPGLIECVSQNDLGNANTAAGATRVTWLTTGGLLGYLRPKTSTGPSWPSNVAPELGQEEDDVLNNDDKKWLIDTFGHMLAFTARERGVSADGKKGQTLFEKIDSIPGKLLDMKIKRQGGPGGDTSLRGTLAWMDSNLQTIMAAVKSSAVQQGVDPAVIEKAIAEALKSAVLPSAKAIADAVVDEQADRLGKKAQ